MKRTLFNSFVPVPTRRDSTRDLMLSETLCTPVWSLSALLNLFHDPRSDSSSFRVKIAYSKVEASCLKGELVEGSMLWYVTAQVNTKPVALFFRSLSSGLTEEVSRK